MRFGFVFIFFVIFCTFELFALDETSAADIITKEKKRYEAVIDTSLELNDYTFSQKGEYVQADFIINGTPLRVISEPDDEKFKKELREVFALNAGLFSEKSDYYIYSKYSNVVAAKGDLNRGDVVFCTSADQKRLSFIVDSFVYENDEKISLLKPLYNSRIFRDARLERKKRPYILDTVYSLAFVNYFRHTLQADLKFTFSYPVLLKVGFRNDVNTSFGFGFEENLTGLSVGLECMLPIDYMFSRTTGLLLYTEFNSFFAILSPGGSFAYTSDVGLGMLWYIKSDFALKFGARLLNIGGLYTFHIPSIQFGISKIL